MQGDETTANPAYDVDFDTAPVAGIRSCVSSLSLLLCIQMLFEILGAITNIETIAIGNAIRNDSKSNDSWIEHDATTA